MDPSAISTPGPRIEALITAGLEGYEEEVLGSGSGHWQIGLPGNGKGRATLVIDKDWLVFERAVGRSKRIRLAHTKSWTRRLLDPGLPLPAGARPVILPGDTQVRLRAELPIELPQLGGPDVLRRWINSLCAIPPFGRRPFWTAVQGDVTALADKRFDWSQEDLLALCEQAGWPATPRGTSGEALAELPSRNGIVCHAIVSSLEDGARIRVALGATGDACSTVSSQAALDIMLLKIAGSVRMVRATASRTGDGIDAAIEVRLEGTPEASSLGHGLSALAIAHEQVADEVDALSSNDWLANTYLAMQGVH